MAAGRDMRARLVLSLQNSGVVSGLRSVQRSLAGIAATARGMGRLPIIGGGLAAALGAGAAVREAARFQTALIDITNTMGMAGETARQKHLELTRLFETLARKYLTSSQSVAEAAKVLFASGLQETAVLGLLDSVTRLSVAERVSVEEAAKLAGALHDVGRIPLDRIYLNLSRITRAGQLGSVEIRDMAREFPALLTLMDQLGVRGEAAVNTLSAALQIARRGAGDANEAMNNMRNLLSKLRSEETVRNFADFGVDLPGVVRSAERQGISVFDALMQKVRQMAGNDPFKLAKLFADMQANAALAPILRSVQDFLTMREQIALATEGVLDSNLGERLKGVQAQLDLLSELADQFGRRIGRGFAMTLGPLNEHLGNLLDFWDNLPKKIDAAREATERWTRSIGAFYRETLKPIEDAFGRIQSRVEQGREFQAGQERDGPVPPTLRRQREGERGRLPGFYGRDPAVQPQSAPGEQRGDLRGRIEIALAPGLVLRRADTDGGGVRFVAPDRGQMLPAI